MKKPLFLFFGLFICSLNVSNAAQCNGIPTTGTIFNSDLDTVCMGESVQLILSGATADSGIILKWQFMPFGTGFWNNGGGNDSSISFNTQPLASHTYYRCKITCTNSGLVVYTLPYLVFTPGIIDIAGDTVCAPGTYSFNANGVGTVNWFVDASTSTVLQSGNTLNATIAGDTIFYSENDWFTYTQVGPPNNTYAGGNLNYNTFQYAQMFHVFQDLVIDTVFVYPNSAGNVKINLIDSITGVVIDSIIHPVTSGQVGLKTPIPVAFSCSPGGYRMNALGSTVSGLYRNSGGTVYPFFVPGYITIHGNTAPGASDRWYFEYDWQIHFGCSSPRVPNSIHVGPLNVVANATSDSICLGDAVTLNASGAINYTFEPGSLSGQTVMVSPTTTTVYTITGTVDIACSDMGNITIVVNNPPSVSASGTVSTICSGSNATLAANGASSYAWSPGGYSGSPVTVTPSNTTTYTVTGTDLNGCMATDTATVLVDFVAITGTAAESTLCFGDSTQLTANGGLSYTWAPGGFPGASVMYTPATTVTLTVTGTNSNGCTGTDTASIQLALANITIFTSTDTVCPGDSSHITCIGATSYFWNPGSFTGSDNWVTPTVSTTYTVTGSLAPLGCQASNTVFIAVDNYPTANFTYSNVGFVYEFQNTSTDGFTYQWLFPDSLMSLSVNPTFAFPANGTYTIGLIVFNACGSDTIYQDLVVDEDISSGIIANTNHHFKIYPNPFAGKLTIESGPKETGRIEIRNIMGQLLISEKLTKGKNQVGTENLPAGIYTATISSGDSQSVHRLIKP